MALEGGEARPPVPLIDLVAQQQRLGDRPQRAIDRVLKHGQYILGPEVDELEERLADFSGVRHAISCSSGTDALVMALLALEVGVGDAVVVPAFTFAASAEAVMLVGATPVLADVKASTFNLDVDRISTAVSAAEEAGLRPRAVIAVDLFGYPADYEALEGVARQHGMHVIADAAQSYGASAGGVRVGALGDIATTSFYPSKPLSCYGDGGAVFTSNDEMADRLRSIRVHGAGDRQYHHVRLGINGRLDTIQAAILLEKLAVFEEELAARQAAAAGYSDLLHADVTVPNVRDGFTSAWAHYTVRVPNRDSVATRLREAGIATGIYYPIPLHAQPVFERLPRPAAGLAESEALAGCVLSLPLHPYLTSEVQERVAEGLLTALASFRASA